MRNLLTSFLVFLLFLGFHTGIALTPGGTLLAPYFLTFISAVGILCLNTEALRFRFVLGYLLLALVLVAMAVITSRVDGELSHHLISSATFLYSMLIAYGTFVGLSTMGSRKVSRLFLIIAVVLIVGSFLELHAGLKPMVDAARHYMDAWRPKMIYSSDLRDKMLYGGVRPNFFASEPSLLGVSVGYAILFWFLAGNRFTISRLGSATVMAATGYIIVRSPTILACWLVACLFYATELGRTRTVPRARVITVGICSLLTIFITPIIVAENTNYGTTASFYEREIGPPLVTAEVLRTQPFFGTGFGGTQSFIASGQAVYAKAGGDAESELLRLSMGDEDDAKRMLSSQFWELWIDLGLVGGVLMLWMLWRYFRLLSVPNRFLVFTTGAIIFTLMGGIVTPGAWIALFSIAALYRMHHSYMTGEMEQAGVQAQAGIIMNPR